MYECWELAAISAPLQSAPSDAGRFTRFNRPQRIYNMTQNTILSIHQLKANIIKIIIWKIKYGLLGMKYFPCITQHLPRIARSGVGELWGIKSFYHEYWFKWRLLECAMLWVLLLTRIRYYSPLALLNGDTSTIPTFFFKSQNQAFKRPFNTEFWRKMLRHED